MLFIVYAFIPAGKPSNGLRQHNKAFKFRPVSDLLFVLRALSGLYWILRGLGARVRVTSILKLHGVRLDSDERAGRPGI